MIVKILNGMVKWCLGKCISIFHKILQSIKLHPAYNVLYELDEWGRRLDYDINLMWSDNKFNQA